MFLTSTLVPNSAWPMGRSPRRSSPARTNRSTAPSGHAASWAEGTAGALLSLDAVFPAELTSDAVVRALIVDWLTDFDKHGVEPTLAGLP